MQERSDSLERKLKPPTQAKPLGLYLGRKSCWQRDAAATPIPWGQALTRNPSNVDTIFLATAT